MLNFFDKLKTLAKVGNISKSFHFFSNNQTTNNITNNVFVINDKKELEGVNLGNLTPELEKQIGPMFKDAPKGTTFLRTDTTKLLQEAKKSLSENQKLIDFFKDKLPPGDLYILKSALVLRDKFKQGEHVSEYKMQLADTYGAKAFVICNLVTADYFEDFLIPLYGEMSKRTGFVVDDFKEAYKKLIRDFPVAIFVNSKMDEKEIEEKVRMKIERNKKYSVPYLNIHGIGERNIRVIEKVINSLDSKKDYTQKAIDRKGDTIVVRLRFD